MLYSLLPLLLLLLLVALVAVMFRMLFYRLSHTHTHTQSWRGGRLPTADSGQSRVECRLFWLWTAPAPCRAARAVQNCYIHMSTCKCVSVCLSVCHSPGSCMHSHVCCFLVASFCRHFARWLAAIFIARQLWTSSVLQMISIPG